MCLWQVAEGHWGVGCSLTTTLVTKLPDNYHLFFAMIYASYDCVTEQGLT